MKDAVIYARVSTDKQEEQRSIESQLAELREICRRDGVNLIREYTDDGISGTTLARPGLDRLRDDASKGMFQAVYILSPDRLARKYVYQALVLEELQKHAVEIVFLNKPVTDKPEDQLLLGIQGLVAEYERAQIMERSRRGMLHRSRNGEIMGGQAPFGYAYVARAGERPAHYRVNEDEAKAVRLIFSLYLELSSIHGVIKELARRGVKTRKGALYWKTGSIHSVLTRENYVGKAYYNKREWVGQHRQKRDRTQWVPISVPGIVDDQTFEAAQQMLKRNNGGKKLRLYLLSGLMKCHYCGSAYLGQSSKAARYSYYRCGNPDRRVPLPKNCHARSVRTEVVERAVLLAIKEAVANPEVLTDHILAYAKKSRQDALGFEERRRKLLNRKRTLEEREKRLLDLFLDGMVSKGEYGDKKEEFEAKKVEVDVEIGSLGEEVPVVDHAESLKSVRHFCAMARQKMDKLTPDQARHFLRSLVEKMVFDWQRMEVRIIGHIPAMNASDILRRDSTGWGVKTVFGIAV